MKKEIKAENEKILKIIENYNNNNKKTIAIFCDAYYPAVDGVIKVFENHAKLLSAKNNVIVCVPKHKSRVDNKRNYLVIGTASMPVSSVGYDLGFPNNDTFFNKAMKKARIDIIHLHSPFSLGNYAVSLAKKKHIPVIGTFHSLYKQDFYKATKNKAISKILTNIIISVFNKCNIVTTMNNFAAEKLRDYGYTGEIILLQNATDFKMSNKYIQKIKKVREELCLYDYDMVFSYMGRIITEKQVFFILDILKELKERGYKIKLIVIGTGVEIVKFKNKIREYKLKDNIYLAGMVKDAAKKASLIGASDLFVFPSTYDTDGIVKIEAAYMKIPTICVENTGVSSTITDNVNGYISKLDKKIFTDRIINIFKDKEKLKIIGENAYRDLAITWNDIYNDLVQIYENEINKNTIERIKRARKYRKISKQDKTKNT